MARQGEKVKVTLERLPNGDEVLLAGERVDLKAVGALEGTPESSRLREEVMGMTNDEVMFVRQAPTVVGSMGFLRFGEEELSGCVGAGLVFKSIGVPRQVRRKGVARQLLKEFLRIARERGTPNVDGVVNRNDDKMKPLLESLGFEEFSCRQSIIIYRKQLTGNAH